MAYAEILVFGPNEKDIEFQNGRTDRLGRFLFYPDRSGEWRMTVRDGRGHAANAVVHVEDLTSQAAIKTSDDGKSASPGWRDVALGLSLIANIAFVAGLIKRRQYVAKRAGKA